MNRSRKNNLLVVWASVLGMAVCVLLAASAQGANPRFYTGDSGQTLYVRFEKVPNTTWVAVALTEGTTGSAGNYTAPEGTGAGSINAAGLNAAGTFNWTVRAGSPSTTAADPIVAYGDIAWTGSAESNTADLTGVLALLDEIYKAVRSR